MMRGADVVGVVGKSAFWVQSRVGLSFSPFSIWFLCRRWERVTWILGLLRPDLVFSVSGFQICGGVGRLVAVSIPLGVEWWVPLSSSGQVGLRGSRSLEARTSWWTLLCGRGSYGVCFVRLLVFCLSGWPSMTNKMLFRRSLQPCPLGFAAFDADVLVFVWVLSAPLRLFSYLDGSPPLLFRWRGNMELSSVLDASARRGSWIFGFQFPRRSLVFRLVIPATLSDHLVSSGGSIVGSFCRFGWTALRCGSHRTRLLLWFAFISEVKPNKCGSLCSSD